MATLTKVLFYLDDDSNFPLEMPIEDVLGNTGISSSEGYTIIPEIRSGDNLTLRIINFAPSPAAPSSKFGSILGICYVYNNGAKTWVESVVHTGPSATNLTVAVGGWLEGKTISQARSDANYRKPYIGYVTASDYAEYRIEAYQEPPEPQPPHVPMTGTLTPMSAQIRIGESINFKVTLSGDNTVPISPQWIHSNAIERTSIRELSAILKFNKSGTHIVGYDVSNSLGEKFTTEAHITVADPATITTNILQSNTRLTKGDLFSLTSMTISDAYITDKTWDVPPGVDIQSSTGDQIILRFGRIGVYAITFRAKNSEGSEASDHIEITVVDPPKKILNIGMHMEAGDEKVEVNPSLTLNNFPINMDSMTLIFKNTGESLWTYQRISIEVGSESFTYMNGKTIYEEELTIMPGSTYNLRALIHNFDVARKYSIVIKATVRDSQGQELTRFYELRWYAVTRPEHIMEPVEHIDENYKFPSTMKRNSRFRGQRESEKVLSDHQEQLYDIRVNHIDIQKLKDSQAELTKSWFSGESEAPAENITYSAVKTFQVLAGQSSYPLMPGVPASSFSNLVIFLKEAKITTPADYMLDNGYIKLNSNVIQVGNMKASYTVTISVAEQHIPGIQQIRQHMERMNEQVGEMERRYNRYENTYK